MLEVLGQFITHETGTWILPLLIIICAFFLEDLTSIIVGILAAEGLISIPFALCSIISGIILGDMTLYSLGRLARTHPRLARYVDHDLTASFRAWMERQYPLVVFSGHFVPGLRFTTYLASGFFHRPLILFVPLAIAGGISLGTGFFTLAYWFGSVTGTWLRPVRYVIAALFIVALIVLGRRSLERIRSLHGTNTGADSRVP